jgi:hypothetical protein
MKKVDIFEAGVLKGRSGKMGEVLLQRPIESITVYLRNRRGQEFDFYAELKASGFSEIFRPTMTKEKRDEEIHPDPFEGVKRGERGGYLTITGKRENRFLVSTPDDQETVIFSTGFVKKGNNKEEKIFPGLEKNYLVASEALDDLASILKISVAAIYHRAGIEPDYDKNDKLILITPEKRESFIWRTLKNYIPGDWENVSDYRESAYKKSRKKGWLGQFEIEKSGVSFDHIGGQKRAKKKMEEIVIAMKRPDLYKKNGIKLPKGILFHGPPGTGKTLMVRALANEVNNFRILSIEPHHFVNSALVFYLVGRSLDYLVFSV